mgnify:CR=1 FL=1
MILWLENIINFHTKHKQYDSKHMKHMKDNPFPTQKCTNIAKHTKWKEIDWKCENKWIAEGLQMNGNMMRAM